MPRLFISADLPQNVRDRLSEISFGLPGANWVPQEQLHLTLRFIGDVDHGLLSGIQGALDGIQNRSFYLSLKGVGHFPLRGDPEVLWAGVAKSDDLMRLRNRIESLLVRNGVQPDARKFHPHVTLARLKDSRAQWLGSYIVNNSLFSIPEIPVQGFSLYSSKLTSDGAIHRLEGSYALDGMLEGAE
jgi:2'-5' RNA ligase